MSDVAEIAKRLTARQWQGLRVPPAWGFPAGHNAWPEMCYGDETDEPSEPDEPSCEGEDMDFLLRSGLVEAIEEGDTPPPECCFEMADAIWTLRLTSLGKRVLASEEERLKREGGGR